MNRTLTLRRESLAPLTDGDLAAVAGAGQEIKTVLECHEAQLPTLPLHWCFVTTPATPVAG